MAKRRSVANAIDHGQRRQVIAESLLNEIVQGKRIAGERLVIQSLAERFGVSQSPIREALVSLEAIGVVDIQPNCGAVIRRMTKRDVREAGQVRRALECAAVRLACTRISRPILVELIASFRELERLSQVQSTGATPAKTRKLIDRARLLDSELHDLVAQSCGNRFLAKELNRLTILFRVYRDIAWDRRVSEQDVARVTEEALEHLEIAQALLRNDKSAAARAMSNHIRSGVKYWSRDLPTSR